MKKINITVFLFAAMLLLSGCSSPLQFLEDELSKPKSVMVQGELVDLKFDNEKFTFAFTDAQNKLYSNREMKRNYEILMDNSLSEPEIEYEMIYQGKKEKEESEQAAWNGDSRRLITIKLSQDDYYKVFGDSKIELKNN